MRLPSLESRLLRRSPSALAAICLVILCRMTLVTVNSSPAPRLSLTPCHLEFLAEEVQCGVLLVFENRAAGSGPQIPIHVAVLPALRRSTEPDPLFVLAGGPGQGARSFAAVAARYFKQVRRTRAIVLVDLRGTGASHPLDCPRAVDEIERLGRGADVYLGNATDCLSALRADLRQYTHATALADLEEVRQRLGYGRINLWGGSWGTRAAVLFALTYPDAVRTLVLDGAVALDLGFPRPVARHAQRALDRLIERCAEDPVCADAFPNPRAELTSTLSRLDRNRTATIRHPRTGARLTITITPDAVAEVVRVALYTPTDAARLLLTIHHAAQGDYGPLAAELVHSASMSSDDMALGFTMAVLCSEDMPLSATADFRSDSVGTFLGASYAEAWRSRCSQWPAGPRIAIDSHASSRAPALILSGEYDPVTPPSTGEAMGRHFPNHLHVVVPGAAHNASFTGCVPELIAAFLSRGSVDPQDAECVNRVPLPPIVVSDAGGRP